MSKRETPESVNRLRGLTIGKKRELRKRTVEYFPEIYEQVDGEWDIVGFEEEPILVQVRQPTVGERNKLISECRTDIGTIDEMEFILQAAINLTYDPESGERLFTKQDYDVLSSQPTGGFIDQFGEEAIKLISLGKPQRDGSASSEKNQNSKPSMQ